MGKKEEKYAKYRVHGTATVAVTDRTAVFAPIVVDIP